MDFREKRKERGKVSICIEEGKPKLQLLFGVLGTETNIKLKMSRNTAIGKEEAMR